MLKNLNVSSLAILETNLYAGTIYGGIFRSTDNGTNWTSVNEGLTNTYVNSIVVSGSNLFAGTDGGVFLSTNKGLNWSVVNNGFTSLYIDLLAASGTNIFAGTYGNGIFLSQITV